jgi:phosphohistidine phosphatase
VKRLLVMRHAKSDWEVDGSDHDRPLNARGLRSADGVGDLLARIGEVPDHAISSDAQRARTTTEMAVAAGNWSTEIESTRELYTCTVEVALEVAAKAPDVETLMLVGHQPTWGELVKALTGGDVQMRTATVVGIDLPISSWTSLPGAIDAGSIAFVLQANHFLDGPKP